MASAWSRWARAGTNGEVGHRFHIGGLRGAALPGSLPVSHSLRRKACLGGVMRQQFGLRLHRLGTRFQRLCKLLMVALLCARQ
jgi:hypothetical protein